ncbi:MAG: NAD-binding protein, partial [Actinomycetota bacterium]
TGDERRARDERLGKILISHLGGDSAHIDGYGKGTIVGSAGEIEHGAMGHIPGGGGMRAALGNGTSIVPSTKTVAGMGARVTLMGSSGAGQITKMTNQICAIGLCQALAEGLDFAETAGLDVAKVIHVMLQGSSASWQMANRAERMLAGEYDYGFSNTLMRKDIGLGLEEARNMNIPLPVTAMVGQMRSEVAAMGGANWDWCSLMERQRQRRVS